MTINRYLAVLLLMATPAAAGLEPYKGSDGRIFPGLEPYWGAYTPRQETPRLGDNGGQANPEYRVVERGDWDNNTAPGTTYGSPGDYRGSNVSIDLPDGPGNIRAAIQGMIQDFGRAIGIDGTGETARASTCVCSGDGNYDSRSGGSGTSYK